MGTIINSPGIGGIKVGSDKIPSGDLEFFSSDNSILITLNISTRKLDFKTTGASAITWGGIGGTLSDQTDLQNALNAKLNKPANMEFGTVDPFGRTQIWNFASNASFRLGSLGSDGDPTTSSSEGIVVYGQNAQGDVMAPADFSYARIKPTRFGIYNSKNNIANYIFRVDPTSFYLADDAFSKTFEVTRATGNIKTKLSAGFVKSDSSGNLIIGSLDQTNKYFVDGVLGNDVTADGSITKPYKTIQACLNAIGQPINRTDAMRHISIFISDSLSASPGYATQTFNGCYEENLTVPSRMITMYGAGVKIGSAGITAGVGNITKEYSSSRRFGATSSELRPCLTLVGVANARDSHPRLRNGFHIAGNCRTAILKRNFDSIQGNGVNQITVQIAAGQFTYPITVPSTYPSEPYIRIAVQNTVNYNGTYDITSKIDDTHFIATRISGTNANTGIETSGTFFESDSAGASGITHDSHFINTYMQGEAQCDDGVINSAAPTAGTEVMYAVNSRFFTGIRGAAILAQRFEDCTLAGASAISSIAGMFNCSFAGTFSVNTFTYSTDDMGFMNCRFNSAVPFTVLSAGQTARMDSVTYNSFLSTASAWVTNTPTVAMLDSIVSLSRPRTATAASITATNKDFIIGVTSTAAARTITLPLANSLPAGYTYIIKDESGLAGTNNITVARAGADTLEGATSALINTNYGKLSIYTDGVSKWFII